MSDYQKLANDLIASLQLSLPPIAVSFCDAVPPNVSSFDGVVAAGCVRLLARSRDAYVCHIHKRPRTLRDWSTYPQHVAAFSVTSGRASVGSSGHERT